LQIANSSRFLSKELGATSGFCPPEKLHILNHQGEFLRVRGPLDVARPIQGWPVIVQAGASEAGRQLAAETAEVIFAAGNNLAGARAFYADVKGRMEISGVVRRPKVGERGEQIAVGSYLVLRHFPVCEDSQEGIDGVVSERPVSLLKKSQQAREASAAWP
jgi:luciferase-like monooxygenase